VPHPRKCRDYLNQPAQRESNVPSKKGRPAPIEPCSPRATAHLLHAPLAVRSIRCIAPRQRQRHSPTERTNDMAISRHSPHQASQSGIERVETGE